jgi:leucyl aminopeptidase
MTDFAVRTGDPAADADLLVACVFEGPEPGPHVSRGALEEYGAAGLTGRLHESLLVARPGASAELLVGLGPRSDLSPDVIRRVLGKTARSLLGREVVEVALPDSPTPASTIAASVEGCVLGAYAFERYRTQPSAEPRLRTIRLLVDRADPAGEETIRVARLSSEAACWARDLVNTPALDCTPEHLAQHAEGLASLGLDVEVWREDDLARERCAGILSVGRGSSDPPRLIIITYRGDEKHRSPSIALAGKGITFDAGGTSLKDAAEQEWMKADMAGGASVLATMRAIALLRPPIHVVAAIPAAENLTGPTATRPGDVVTLRSGLKCEIVNTDYEGRVVLADALDVLRERGPAVIVDAGTLTGAAMEALGRDMYAVIGNDQALVNDVLAAGEATGEFGWQLPMWRRYRTEVESRVADLKNMPGRWGGAITAALFLHEFVGDTPWAHLDICGPAWAEEPGDYWPAGGTGNPTRTLIRFVLDRVRGGPS